MSADAGASFVEPNAIVADTIDAYSLQLTKQYRLCAMPAAAAIGPDQGMLDASRLVCRSTVVYYINPSEPNRAGEAYVITYTATNSRSM